MVKGQIHIVVSMDCERIRSESYRHDGTESWEMSERAIIGLAELLHEEGMKGSFLPTPATAAKHATLFGDLRSERFELGMQFHCDSFRDGEYTQVLGSYGYDKQKEILSLAKADWEDALGIALHTYRSGYLSANDYTFPILEELGIRQTSCSKAGRYRPSIAARWYGAPPYAHRPSASNRLLPGNLDIVEVPVASHPAERFSPEPSWDPTDPRPDRGLDIAVYKELVDACLREMEMIGPKVKTFVILTHNTLDYGSSEEPRRAIMVEMLRYIKSREEEGWEIVPATFSDVRRAYYA